VNRLSNKRALIYICAPAILIVMANLLGLRYNYSSSVTGKLWYETRVADYYRGDYVFICIKNVNVVNKIKPYLIKGNCGGAAGLLKKIVGIGGDDVDFSPEGISVNRIKIENTQPLDGNRLLHKLLPYQQSQVLLNDYVVVVGETYDSLDSRYLGPIHKKWITGKASKLL